MKDVRHQRVSSRAHNRFIRRRFETQDDPPKPSPPPFPFPVDPSPGPPPRPSPVLLNDSSSDEANKNNKNQSRIDGFYWAWDRFYKKPSNPKWPKLKSLDFDAKGHPSHTQKRNEDGVNVHENAVTSYEEAAKACRSKVNAIVKEARRLNIRYCDRSFSPDWFDCLRGLNSDDPPDSTGTFGVADSKRIKDIFDKPVFLSRTPESYNITQGIIGDCWFLSGVTSLFGNPELLNKLCVARDEQVGVYGFVFFRDGEWISEVVDDFLAVKHGDSRPQQLVTFANDIAFKKPLVRTGTDVISTSLDKEYRESLRKGWKALYFSSCRDSQETWLPLLEKAYAKAHGDYNALDGGYCGEAIEDLTGGVSCQLQCDSILDIDELWSQLKDVNKSYLFGVATKHIASETYRENGVAESHAYAVLEAHEIQGERLLKIRNPWASGEWQGPWSDGSKEWTPERMKDLGHTFGDDGVFWMTLQDMLLTFRCLDRTRLFGEEWTVSQQWTTMLVSPTPSYLSTYFSMEVKEAGPHVIVLSQPDRRYFKGLESRHRYYLHFRVYKDGEDSWLCRSMSSSFDDIRSCHVEVDLEPGTYSIYVKVSAYRRDYALTVRETIQRFRVNEKDKLTEVGLRFDMVASKGKLREFEEAFRARMKHQAMEEHVDDLRQTHALNRDTRLREVQKGRRSEEAQLRKAQEKRQRRHQLHLNLRQERLERLGKSNVEKSEQSGYQNSKAANGTTSESDPSARSAAQRSEDTNTPSSANDTSTAPYAKTSIAQQNKPADETAGTKEEAKDTKTHPPPAEANDKVERASDSSNTSSGVVIVTSDAAHEPTTTKDKQEPTKTSKPVDDIEAKNTTTTTNKPIERSTSHPSTSNPTQFFNPSGPQQQQSPFPFIKEADSESETSLPSPIQSIDFSWTSEIDRPTNREIEADLSDVFPEDVGDENGVDSDDSEYGKDPWRAAVVLGLRVYGRSSFGDDDGREREQKGDEERGSGEKKSNEKNDPNEKKDSEEEKEDSKKQNLKGKVVSEKESVEDSAEVIQNQIKDPNTTTSMQKDSSNTTTTTKTPSKSGVILSVIGDGGLDEYFSKRKRSKKVHRRDR